MPPTEEIIEEDVEEGDDAIAAGQDAPADGGDPGDGYYDGDPDDGGDGYDDGDPDDGGDGYDDGEVIEQTYAGPAPSPWAYRRWGRGFGAYARPGAYGRPYAPAFAHPGAYAAHPGFAHPGAFPMHAASPYLAHPTLTAPMHPAAVVMHPAAASPTALHPAAAAALGVHPAAAVMHPAAAAALGVHPAAMTPIHPAAAASLGIHPAAVTVHPAAVPAAAPHPAAAAAPHPAHHTAGYAPHAYHHFGVPRGMHYHGPDWSARWGDPYGAGTDYLLGEQGEMDLVPQPVEAEPEEFRRYDRHGHVAHWPQL